MKFNVIEEVTYRQPLAVTEILLLPNGEGFSVCPRCKVTLEWEYQSYCDRCGQCLDWDDFDNAKIIKWKPKKL